MLACLCLLTALPVAAGARTAFSDVPRGHWAAESISRAAELGLMNGRSADLLQPQGTAIRAEVAAMFHRFIASPLQ